MTDPAIPDPPPVVEIVRGRPTAEEVAALVIALQLARRAREPSPSPAAGSVPSGDGWTSRRRGLRTSLRPGRDAWRLSGRG